MAPSPDPKPDLVEYGTGLILGTVTVNGRLWSLRREEGTWYGYGPGRIAHSAPTLEELLVKLNDN